LEIEDDLAGDRLRLVCYNRKFGDKARHEFYVNDGFNEEADDEEIEKLMTSILTKPQGDPHGK